MNNDIIMNNYHYNVIININYLFFLFHNKDPEKISITMTKQNLPCHKVIKTASNRAEFVIENLPQKFCL